MGRETGTLTFDEWVEYAFDRPVGDPPWYCQEDEHGEDSDGWEPNSVGLATYLAQLFESPNFLIPKYSLDQISQAFRYSAGANSGYFPITRGPFVGREIQAGNLHCTE
jgi:hypothetical protein